jgi:hypothetical protein
VATFLARELTQESPRMFDCVRTRIFRLPTPLFWSPGAADLTRSARLLTFAGLPRFCEGYSRK